MRALFFPVILLGLTAGTVQAGETFIVKAQDVRDPAALNKIVARFHPGDRVIYYRFNRAPVTFDLGAKLGSGSTGVVFQLPHTSPPGVVKFQFFGDMPEGSKMDARKYMQSEIEVFHALERDQRLEHARLRDSDPLFFVEKEYISGPTLSSIENGWHLMNDTERITILRRLSRALPIFQDELRQTSVAVADLKRDNLILSERGPITVVDALSGRSSADNVEMFELPFRALGFLSRGLRVARTARESLPLLFQLQSARYRALVKGAPAPNDPAWGRTAELLGQVFRTERERPAMLEEAAELLCQLGASVPIEARAHLGGWGSWLTHHGDLPDRLRIQLAAVLSDWNPEAKGLPIIEAFQGLAESRVTPLDPQTSFYAKKALSRFVGLQARGDFQGLKTLHAALGESPFRKLYEEVLAQWEIPLTFAPGEGTALLQSLCQRVRQAGGFSESRR